MGFQDSAESLKAKLHLGKASVPMLVGIAALLLTALVATVLMLGDILFTESLILPIGNGETVDILAEGKDGLGETDPSLEADVMDSSDFSQPIQPILIAVHVSGAVVSPGVYTLEEGSRVDDAIAAAGGAVEEAAPDALNRARVLSDGEQVIVPTKEELAQQQAAPQTPTAGAPSLPQGRVNINTATVEQLDALPGVGEATALKIISDREQNGPFSSPEDLKRVSGIGDKKYEELADLISIG